MRTVRLIYPDALSGGLAEYSFGARLMAHIIPANSTQETIEVDCAPPDGASAPSGTGIHARDEVVAAIVDAQGKLEAARPDRVVTVGGTCIVSLAPFDYLHGLGGRTGIIWIDSHPDVSREGDGYPYAHAMVLGALLGTGEETFSSLLRNRPFSPDEVLYVGLQGLLDYQKRFLDENGVDYSIQDEAFVSDGQIALFCKRFDNLLVHLDVDVLDEKRFHSTYFASPEAHGDGSAGGRMTSGELGHILRLIESNGYMRGLTIAEYLPFDEYRLHRIFSSLDILTGQG